MSRTHGEETDVFLAKFHSGMKKAPLYRVFKETQVPMGLEGRRINES